MLDIPRPTDIQSINTPQEAAEMRAHIAALIQLVPQMSNDRRESWKMAYEGNRAFVIASIKAGEIWAQIDGRRGPGQTDASLPNWENAGFSSRNDAMTCQRLAELDAEDVRVYFEDCLDNNRMPTVHGLHAIWKDYFGDPPHEDECTCYVCGNVHKRKKVS